MPRPAAPVICSGCTGECPVEHYVLTRPFNQREKQHFCSLICLALWLREEEAA